MRLIIALVGIAQISGEPSAGAAPGVISSELQNKPLGKDLVQDSALGKDGSGVLGVQLDVFSSLVNGDRHDCTASKATSIASVIVKISIKLGSILLVFAYRLMVASQDNIALNKIVIDEFSLLRDPEAASVITKKTMILSELFNTWIATFQAMGTHELIINPIEIHDLVKETMRLFKCEGQKEVPGKELRIVLKDFYIALMMLFTNFPGLVERLAELTGSSDYNPYRRLARAGLVKKSIEVLIGFYKLVLSKKAAHAQEQILKLIKMVWCVVQEVLATRLFNNLTVSDLNSKGVLMDFLLEVLTTDNRLLDATSDLFSMGLTLLENSLTNKLAKRILRFFARGLKVWPDAAKLLLWVAIPSAVGAPASFFQVNAVMFNISPSMQTSARLKRDLKNVIDAVCRFALQYKEVCEAALTPILAV